MNRIDWKDVAARTLKTFFQVFLTSITIDGVFHVSDRAGLEHWLLNTGLPALSAAVCAVWNLVMDMFGEKIGELLDKIFGKKPDDGEAAGQSETEEAGEQEEENPAEEAGEKTE